MYMCVYIYISLSLSLSFKFLSNSNCAVLSTLLSQHMTNNNHMYDVI